MEAYNRRQEIVNGLIHGLGMVFGISGLPVLTGIATAHGNDLAIVGSGIYGFCYLLLFTNSTIYHIAREPEVKLVFKILDHISIYFLISGTYTPFLLVYMNNSFGITLLVILWGLTLIGIFFKIKFTGKMEAVSTTIYVIMGLLMLVGGKRFFNYLPQSVVIFLCIGMLLYLVGVFFYVWDKYMYTHAVWHSLVLSAAICHYVAVLLAI